MSFLALLLCLSIASAEHTPKGKYCGILGRDRPRNTVDINVDDDKHLDIIIVFMGEQVICSKEEYTYEPWYSGGEPLIILKNIKDDTNCVNKAVKFFGADPAGTQIAYDKKADTIGINIVDNVGTLTAKACKPSVRSFKAPSYVGQEYCGRIGTMRPPWYATITMHNSTNLHLFTHVFGVNTNCTDEPYTYDKDAGVFTLTNVMLPSDCVGQTQKFFDSDPGDVLVQYDPVKNEIGLSMVGNVGTLAPAECSGATATEIEQIVV